ncbi:four helix bundle protein [bacterium]|nr:four helix bundle protein [bacterium]
MPGSKSYERTEVWNDARKLTKNVFHVTKSKLMKGEYFLQDQLKKSALSILSNIAEGFERDGNKELLQFLSLAKGSAGELRSQLLAGYDMGLVTKEDFQQLHDKVMSISRQLSGFMKYLKGSTMRGRKYKDR